MKSLDIAMNERHFDGTDPTTVFQFFLHFVRKADKRNMSEGQAYLALLQYINGIVKSAFMSMENGLRAGGIICRPEIGTRSPLYEIFGNWRLTMNRITQ